jgi:starch synthase
MSEPSYRVLFAASEAYPLIKTGGLADVAGSLPRTLTAMGHDVRLVLPAYADIFDAGIKIEPVNEASISGHTVWLLKASLPDSNIKIWLVDCPEYFDRPGNPYLDSAGEAWPDNAQRFSFFNRIVALLANDALSMKWRPDIVHLNDWQTGLVPVFMRHQIYRPALIYTIHNLAYQGLFDRDDFDTLRLPKDLWHYEKLEYHGKFSFMKGGLLYADKINTVSPTYAEEIKTTEYGCGLEGVLQYRSQDLSGIVNGIDTNEWDPATDKSLASHYSHARLADKLPNKSAIQQQLGLQDDSSCMLLGLISRLAHQKGIDLVLDALPKLMQKKIQLVVLGSGDSKYEAALRKAASQYRGRMAVHIGYNEKLAHAIEAGADVFLMPSRFEPCGLNQMYSQHYGTIPVVTPVGGLADTVIDVLADAAGQASATGFVMATIDTKGLLDAVQRALALFQDNRRWQQIQLAAMTQDFSWQRSAEAYSALYHQALEMQQQRLKA